MPSDASPKIAFADSLRGIACVCVVISHIFANFWLVRALVASLINAPVLPASVITPPFVIWLYTVVPSFSWAGFGIGLFFLISGFVIPFSLIRFRRTGFIAARILRIFPTYVAGFAVTVLALFLVGAYYGRPFPYALEHVAIHFALGLRDLAWLPAIDGVVWTLEIELKFYLLCAVFAPLLRNPRWSLAAVPLIMTVAYAVLNAYFPPSPMSLTGRAVALFLLEAPYIVFMFVGVVLNFLYRKKIGPGLTVVLIALLLFAFFYGCGFSPYYVAYCSALAMFVLGYLLRDRWPPDPVLGFLAKVSYPLYVVHPILGYGLLRVLLDRGVGVYAALALTTATVLIAAYLIHWLVERPTQRLGHRLGGWLSSEADKQNPVPGPARAHPSEVP